MNNDRLVELAIRGLEAEKSKIDQEIQMLRGSSGRRRTVRQTVETEMPTAAATPKKKTLSAAARKAISRAQKKRWAEKKKAAAK